MLVYTIITKAFLFFLEGKQRWILNINFFYINSSLICQVKKIICLHKLLMLILQNSYNDYLYASLSDHCQHIEITLKIGIDYFKYLFKS